MSFPYTATLPNPPDDPSNDVSGMQENSETINDWVQVDHVGFNNSLGGKHLQVTIPTPQSAPSPSGSVGEITTQTVTNSELFYTNSAANIQLTNSLLTTSSGQGMLPGGLQIRAGSGTCNNPISITPNFPNGIISAVATFNANPSYEYNQIHLTSFSQSSVTFSSQANTGIYWIAIGY